MFLSCGKINRMVRIPVSRNTPRWNSIRQLIQSCSKSPLKNHQPNRSAAVSTPSVAPIYALALPEAKDDARGQTKIVLAPHGAIGVCKCGAQVISGEAHRERPRDGAFDPCPECIGWACHPSLQVFGASDGDCAVNQSRPG